MSVLYVASNGDEDPQPRPKSRRGFAALSPERRRAIARKGGLAAHARGTAHEFTAEEARLAGRQGVATRRAATVVGEPLSDAFLSQFDVATAPAVVPPSGG